jgi:hypothetical protein
MLGHYKITYYFNVNCVVGKYLLRSNGNPFLRVRKSIKSLEKKHGPFAQRGLYKIDYILTV